jgi:hypothetical protein
MEKAQSENLRLLSGFFADPDLNPERILYSFVLLDPDPAGSVSLC